MNILKTNGVPVIDGLGKHELGISMTKRSLPHLSGLTRSVFTIVALRETTVLSY
jgi:hypothetical protein